VSPSPYPLGGEGNLVGKNIFCARKTGSSTARAIFGNTVLNGIENYRTKKNVTHAPKEPRGRWVICAVHNLKYPLGGVWEKVGYGTYTHTSQILHRGILKHEAAICYLEEEKPRHRRTTSQIDTVAVFFFGRADQDDGVKRCSLPCAGLCQVQFTRTRANSCAFGLNTMLGKPVK